MRSRESRGKVKLPAVMPVIVLSSGASTVQSRLQKFRSDCLPDRVDCQFVQFNSGHGGQEPPFSWFSSFRSVHELFRPWLCPYEHSLFSCRLPLVTTNTLVCHVELFQLGANGERLVLPPTPLPDLVRWGTGPN